MLLDVPEYDSTRGVRLEWDPAVEVKLDIRGNQPVLSANPAGLRSLARHLLAWAQEVSRRTRMFT